MTPLERAVVGVFLAAMLTLAAYSTVLSAQGACAHSHSPGHRLAHTLQLAGATP